MTWNDPHITMPETGRPVRCRLQHADTKTICEHLLVHVDESDVTWRTAKGLSELGYDWSVLEWEYLS